MFYRAVYKTLLNERYVPLARSGYRDILLTNQKYEYIVVVTYCSLQT